VARLRRGAFHDALSFSLDRAHSDAGREDRASARHPEVGAVPCVGQPGERRHRTPKSLNGFDPAELVVGPGRGGRKGRLSPRGRDRVVRHVVVEP
jgi:hypothetical protein